MEGGGFFELHAGGRLFAFESDGDDHALAAGVEEFFHRSGFGGVLLGRAGLLAGLDALVHLAVDAAGMLGVGSEVFVAAAEFEEVEDGVAVALGCEARGEGAVHLGEAALGELVGGVDAGEGVLHGHAEEVGGVELEAAAGFGVSEEGGGGVVEDERGFEGGAGDAVLDACDLFAEVEALGLRLGRVEETPHATAEVGGLGEVGCVFGAWAAEREDSGLRGNGAEDLVGLLRCEVYGVIEMEACCHNRIVVAKLAVAALDVAIRASIEQRLLRAGDGHAFDANGRGGAGSAEDEVVADGDDVFVHVFEVAGDGDLFDGVGESRRSRSTCRWRPASSRR